MSNQYQKKKKKQQLRPMPSAVRDIGMSHIRRKAIAPHGVTLWYINKWEMKTARMSFPTCTLLFIAIRNERERDGRANIWRNNVRILQKTRLYLNRHPALLSLTLDKLLNALRARSLPIKDARRSSQVALMNTTNNQLRVYGIFSNGATSSSDQHSKASGR
jgi:hypothetical protein